LRDAIAAPDSPFDARELVGLLAGDHRRRAVAALVLVLDWIAPRFEPGRHYPEATVNVMLAAVHPDTSARRRYLVDDGVLGRDLGDYWRAGGTLDPA